MYVYGITTNSVGGKNLLQGRSPRFVEILDGWTKLPYASDVRRFRPQTGVMRIILR